jgi:hypothetical protein
VRSRERGQVLTAPTRVSDCCTLLLYFSPDVRKALFPDRERASGLRLCAFLGGAEGTRTPDPLVANEVRYQLRHSPVVRTKR